MTKKELLKVKLVLEKIKNRDAFVDEALILIDKDLAVRQQQRKNMKDNLRDGYDY